MGEVVGGMLSAQGSRARGRAERIQAEINARLMEIQAKDAEERGEFQAKEVRNRGKQMRGSQRAALAASGLSIEGDTSANQVLAETLDMTAKDVRQVRENAFREAWGLRQQGLQTQFQGRLAERMARIDASATIAATGLKAAERAGKAIATKGASEVGR